MPSPPPLLVLCALALPLAACGAPDPAVLVLDTDLHRTSSVAFHDPGGHRVDVDGAAGVDDDILVTLRRETGESRTATSPILGVPTSVAIVHGVVARVTRAGDVVWTLQAKADAGVDCNASAFVTADGVLLNVDCPSGSFAGASGGNVVVDAATGDVLGEAPPDDPGFSCFVLPPVDVGDGTVVGALIDSVARGALVDGCVQDAVWTSASTVRPTSNASLHIVGDRVLVASEATSIGTMSYLALDLASGEQLDSVTDAGVISLPAIDGWFGQDTLDVDQGMHIQHRDVHGLPTAELDADGLTMLDTSTTRDALFVGGDAGDGAPTVDLPHE